MLLEIIADRIVNEMESGRVGDIEKRRVGEGRSNLFISCVSSCFCYTEGDTEKTQSYTEKTEIILSSVVLRAAIGTQ